MQDYRINGIGVGHSPDSFIRNTNYLDFFARIGSGSNNIIRIDNFITEEDANKLINISKTTQPQEDNGQWREMIWSGPDTNNILNDYKVRVMSLMKEVFGVDCDFCGGSYVVRWGQTKKMDLHVDDLGSGENHLSAVLYLNDGYTGGNIVFPTHDLSIKPNKYELIVFPGNLNYAHEVQEITDGTRYTVPFWATII